MAISRLIEFNEDKAVLIVQDEIMLKRKTSILNLTAHHAQWDFKICKKNATGYEILLVIYFTLSIVLVVMYFYGFFTTL